MLEQADIVVLRRELRDVSDNLNALQLLLMQKAQAENKLGDWIPAKEASAITGLGRTKLHQLRKEGVIRGSTLGGKAVFYRLSDFKNLLNKNERRK